MNLSSWVDEVAVSSSGGLVGKASHHNHVEKVPGAINAEKTVAPINKSIPSQKNFRFFFFSSLLVYGETFKGKKGRGEAYQICLYHEIHLTL